MDSLTQATLGAGVGELILGRKAGNKAVWWGAVGGTLPDLDIFFSDFFNQVEFLLIHRGFSHSFLFALLLAPLAGFVLSRLHSQTKATATQWGLLFGLALITHGLLDCFTVYGTGMFEPFSSYRIAFNSISIVDPLYSLPLLFCLMVLVFFNRQSNIRFGLAVFGMGLSHFYLLLTVFNSFYIKNQFKSSLQAQNLPYKRIMVTPTLLNNLLWYSVSESEQGYYFGYYSILDDDTEPISFRYLPKNRHLEARISKTNTLAILKYFTKNYYFLVEKQGAIYFKDLRFSAFEQDGEIATPFSINVDDPSQIPWDRPDPQEGKEIIKTIYKRIWGDKEGWW